jgi:hypothetical protein
VLRAFPKGKAGGPSGWTYVHVRGAADTSVAAFEAILKLVNTMIAGQLPHLDSFLDSNLIAIEKPNGGGTRPIGVGKVWVRIAGLGAMAARPAANASLPPLQLSVGVRGGTKATSRALQTAWASDPELQLVRIDYQNAFNTMSRSRTRTRTHPPVFRSMVYELNVCVLLDLPFQRQAQRRCGLSELYAV